MNSSERSASENAAGNLLRPGDVVLARELTTIRSERIRLPRPDMLTHLQFRRFAACPVCNVHLRSVTRRHHEIVSAGIGEVVVFHSPAETMFPYQGELPCAAIADPGRKLYHEFGVRSSPKANLNPRAWSAPLKPETWSVVARGLRAGGKPGPQRESMLGLPAEFLIEPDGRVLAVKYGKHADDQWSVDELLRHAATWGGVVTPRNASRIGRAVEHTQASHLSTCGVLDACSVIRRLHPG